MKLVSYALVTPRMCTVLNASGAQQMTYMHVGCGIQHFAFGIIMAAQRPGVGSATVYGPAGLSLEAAFYQ